MKIKKIFRIIGWIIWGISTIPLFFSFFQFILTLIEQRFNSQFQFWLFFFTSFLLLFLLTTFVFVEVDEKFLSSCNGKTPKPEIIYKSKKKAHICLGMIMSGALSGFISGVTAIYLLALIPIEDLSFYISYETPIGWIITLGIWLGVVLVLSGIIWGVLML